MILIVNVCKEKMHELEFVKPIQELLKKQGSDFFTKHYKELFQEDIDSAEKIIICGTALKDLDYLTDINKFMWIKECKKSILGICAGMQLIGEVFGCEVYDKEVVGQEQVKVNQHNELIESEEFGGYFLNTKTVKLSQDFEVIARTKDAEAIIKHKSKRIYGCLFHPEVMNSEIILNFCKV